MKFDYDREYFSPEDTLECGQVFRFAPYGQGYLVHSADKIANVCTDGNKTVVESDDGEYFYNYFDLARDYKEIVDSARSYSVPLLTASAEKCKGLRILNQNREEMIYSFIISQNNNIPRIKGIIGRLCERLGEKKSSPFGEYYSFPSSAAFAGAELELFTGAGAGYRDVYLKETAVKLCAEGVERLEKLDGDELRAELLKFKGIGPKVADCIALFGFSKMQYFPVDTWIEKVYREDFGGTLKDRGKIAKFFTDKFKEKSGYMQQYLFYGKRLNL